ncbi:MAG: TIGR02186 family protein [Alphaproteobacteria bacterium]|jgi:uncharacterized protein (TIGR02186 family)|nr:TIGR02186 family protein [Alphaproteobacteria bacterium]MDP6515871.1 TIGR02186 family protein [Alphaproteobacteria bacterium]
MNPRVFRHLAEGLLVAATLAGPAPAVWADRLEVDLSQHRIAIEPQFTGAEVLLFGAVDGAGEVVIVLRGPPQPVVVRRKARTAGIWLNRDEIRFSGVPGYYAVAASRPLAEIGTEDIFEANEIGLANLRVTGGEAVSAAERARFRAALIRNKSRQRLYLDRLGAVAFVGRQLFRANFAFPANVPTGRYRADIFLIESDRLISKRSTTLDITKSGLEAALYRYAHEKSWLYGLLAVTVALVAGWLAGVIFRKA